MYEKGIGMKNYTDINAKTIDLWAEKGWEWGIPISHEDYLKAKKGEWSVLLTPIKPVPKEWFPDLKGKAILGLAAGGGQEMPVLRRWGRFVRCWIIRTGSLRARERSRRVKNTTLRS